MLTRITIPLSDDELTALQRLGKIEYRGAKEQARFILRTELIRLGLLVERAGDRQTEAQFQH